MSKFKSLDDVIGYLTNVAEFELRHTEHIKIPDGHMTVISENCNTMFDAIQWITEKLEQPTLNENQQIVLEWLKNEYNSPIIINPIAVVSSLQNELFKDSEIDVLEAYVELGFNEEIEVLQVFSQWMMEHEEE